MFAAERIHGWLRQPPTCLLIELVSHTPAPAMPSRYAIHATPAASQCRENMPPPSIMLSAATLYHADADPLRIFTSETRHY